MEEQWNQSVDLTPREFEVLRLVAKGMTNKKIAEELHLSEKTIENNLTVIYPKIRVENRTQAALWFREVQDEYNSLQLCGANFLSIMHQVRVKGLPWLVIEWAPHIAAWLQKEMDNSKFRVQAKLLLKIRAWLLFELVIAHCETSLSEEILNSIRSKIREIRGIARLCGDEELFGLADYLSGVLYYILGDHAKSIDLLKKALPRLTSDDHKLMVWRSIALDWAYLKKEENFRIAEGEVRHLVDEGNFSNLRFVCMALEGLGRGQGLFGQPSALDTLEEGYRVYAQMDIKEKKQPLPQIQLARSRLEVVCCLAPSDKRLIEQQVEKALGLAQEYGYLRYIQKIESLSESYL